MGRGGGGGVSAQISITKMHVPTLLAFEGLGGGGGSNFQKKKGFL